MNRINTTRDAWHPQTREDRDAILLELHEVLTSPHFCNSKRYPALLQYIVEHTLAGKADLLKERTLGVEVFDRPASYDTNTDTVVRYTAGEVRKRLSLYYHEQGRDSRIHIQLPAGSYVPEFLYYDEQEETGSSVAVAESPSVHEPLSELTGDLSVSSGPVPLSVVTTPIFGHETTPWMLPAAPKSLFRRSWWIVAALLVVALLLTGWAWRYRASHAQTVLDAFWGPVIRDQKSVPICAGSSVFAPNNFSGVMTAGKDIEYPFISMQMASSIARLSSQIQQGGSTVQLLSSASTPLTDLREHPVILLGGYNNKWTQRLLRPLRYHLAAEPNEAILDQTQAQTQWSRDRSIPYSSADDYALVARFRDSTTDGWVVALAGLGRNGTEAAAQFVTSPHYMQLLHDRIGNDLNNKNIEVILKVSVIDGKTAAPDIIAVHVW